MSLERFNGGLETTLTPEESRELKISQEREVFKSTSLELISEAEGDGVLSKTEVHGSAYGSQNLTPDILRKEGFAPEHKIRVGDQLIWFSSLPYEAKHDRLAVVAYVETAENTVARTFYLSSSQGVWRYLPEYSTNADGEISWFSKGWGEESITLPFAVQKALSMISKPDQSLLEPENPSLIFAGTARKKEALRGPATYFSEVQERPQLLGGNFYHDKSQGEIEKTPPEQLAFKEEKRKPDFSTLIDSWSQHSRLYGDVTVSVFPSKDLSLRYMVCRDWRGRAWIAGVENDSPIESTGLRKSWVDAGDIATPAYEYQFPGVDQTGGFGNPNLRKGLYVDMYEKYLSKMPLIQEYLTFFPPEKDEEESMESLRTTSVSETLSEKDRVSVVMDTVSQDKRVRGFIAELSGLGFASRDSVTREMVEGILRKFPTSEALDDGLKTFLLKVERGSGFEKRLQYEQSLKEFIAVAY